MTNKSIFAIICSATPQVHNTKFYSNKNLAREELKKLANERKNKIGVHCFEATEDSFSFLLGWEEYQIKFSILELELDSGS